MDAKELSEVFAKGEVERIYLNFSDPWPKARHAKRRLTSTEFFARYDKILAEDGTVEFKTDNTELFNFSLEQIREYGWTVLSYTYDLHHHEEMNKGNIMTEYEEKFSAKGNPINKLIAGRPTVGERAMGWKRSWKEKLRQKMYCQAELNRQILCIKRSLEEVCAILNTGCCRK